MKHGDLRPGPDFNRDGDSDGFEFDVTIVSTRPVPAGTYEFTSNYIPWKFLKCEGTYSFPHTATVPLPEGVLHELFFDPVAVGSAVAADDTNGVLKPASFTGADGSSATIERTSYEPPSAGSERAGTVKIAITAGSDPDDLLGERLLDFIELDGTVSLSLYVAAATVDTANDTLSWTASSQPWDDGDKLMVRIRRAPPSCSSGAAVPSPGNNPGLVADCKTLLALNSTLAGTATLNWSVESAMSAWDGVSLGGTPRRVTRLALGPEGIDGEYPAGDGKSHGVEPVVAIRQPAERDDPCRVNGADESDLACAERQRPGGVRAAVATTRRRRTTSQGYNSHAPFCGSDDTGAWPF